MLCARCCSNLRSATMGRGPLHHIALRCCPTHVKPCHPQPHRASGFNHSVLVLVTNDTNADLQTALQQFMNDTLISSYATDGAPVSRVYLGPISGELYVAPGEHQQGGPPKHSISPPRL